MKELDFSTVLAIGIHDMKNSLNRVITAVDELVEADSGETWRDSDAVAQLQYEARRMKDNLTKMLTIYRNDHGLYQPDFAPVNLYELLEDCWLNNKPLMDLRGLRCRIECAEDLRWTLDQYLVASLIENVLTNTMRYTKGEICLSARVVDDSLRLTLEDDGPGFPATMLGQRSLHDSVKPDAKLGNTGLGLHFCAMVANLHHAPDGQRGWIELNNDGCLGGGRFLLRLPALM
ncbi:sensor histidine kinase [Rhabdochromatium marinum]|uniref:sensor histidine kinase n=1 Tax=Rhabdochromatium marinum TaxID=48729 RepID=UPI001904BAD4|nr:HAMP domain-containing sensor histidine kinase [Rhabdochromatium marinum]MBK1647363.1 ATP-binding protein [Rhabdochromatium marinum]